MPCFASRHRGARLRQCRAPSEASCSSGVTRPARLGRRAARPARRGHQATAAIAPTRTMTAPPSLEDFKLRKRTTHELPTMTLRRSRAWPSHTGCRLRMKRRKLGRHATQLKSIGTTPRWSPPTMTPGRRRAWPLHLGCKLRSRRRRLGRHAKRQKGVAKTPRWSLR